MTNNSGQIAEADLVVSPDILRRILEGGKRQLRLLADKPRQFRKGEVLCVKDTRLNFVTLIVTEVYKQKLQDMAVTDIAAEGYRDYPQFKAMWNSIYIRDNCEWDNNPAVQVLEFERE